MRPFRQVIIALLMLFFMTSVMAAELTNIRVFKLETGTRVIFSLTKPTQPHVFLLQNPNRLVVDFDHTKLDEHLQNLAFPTREIKSIRGGYPAPKTLRLVLDSTAPVQFTMVPLEPGQEFTLDIFFTKISATPASVPVVIKAVPKKTLQQSHRITTIVIDAGHGGKDPGALGPHGIQEKNVVLGIAKQLAEIINKQPNMRAVLTRNGDYFVPLRDRLRLARKGKADVFLSIHADSYFDVHANGASVYALSRRGATSEAARWLAKRENTSELGGVDLANLEDKSYLLRSVLIDLAQTATTTGSLRLGTSVLDTLDSITDVHYTRVEQAPFVVLKSPDIPSILVEVGFISNGKEELHLQDKRYQNQLAQALFNGIQGYLKKYSYT